MCQPKPEGGLGFKDLCSFNEAMLAKQVWRLVHDTDSHFYKVFKAKYFPHSSIFEAKLASGSFAWKSILFARRLVEKEARWRVGDGKSIRIFHDSWLPNSSDGKVASPQNSLALDSTVDTLIDAQTGWWNTHLIDLCFYPPEVALIKSLPLCTVSQPDILIWPKENSGTYLVKSGYKSLMEVDTFDTIRPPILATQKSFWKIIWKLKVPGKVKHFLWRSCTNFLPSKENLLKRAIPIDPICHLCQKFKIQNFKFTYF